MAAGPQSPRLNPLSPQDLAATVVSILLVLAVVMLSITEKPVPSELGTALGAAITWLFVRSAQQAERNRPTIGDQAEFMAYQPKDSRQPHEGPIVHADPATTEKGSDSHDASRFPEKPDEHPPGP